MERIGMKQNKRVKTFLFFVVKFVKMCYYPDFDSCKSIKTPYALIYKVLESFILLKKVRTLNI